MARIFDTTCGDIYDTATMMQYWDTYLGAPGNPARVISNEPGATGQCIVIDQLAYSVTGFIRKNLPDVYSRLILGMRFKYSTLPIVGNRVVCAFYDTPGVELVDLQLSPDGSMSLWRGGSHVGGSSAITPPGLIHANTWTHVGLDIQFSDTSANVTLWLNSKPRMTLTAVPTAVNANGAAMFAIVRSGGSPADEPVSYFDDIYINDTSGSRNNGFDGDIQGLAFLPNAAGQYTQMSIGGTSPAATNYQSVNETAPDGDTTYVSALTNGLKDTYGVGPLPADVIQIVSVTTAINAKTDTSGLGAGATIAPIIGDGASISTGADFALNTSYAYNLQYYGINPLTALAWSLSDWPNIEVGQTRTH